MNKENDFLTFNQVVVPQPTFDTLQSTFKISNFIFDVLLLFIRCKFNKLQRKLEQGQGKTKSFKTNFLRVYRLNLNLYVIQNFLYDVRAILHGINN